ncbi:MAG: hypothetical protein FWC40_00795, partial [Proteobacteria bacterium]|nr:hypothetical protein [Pseudomonadota bacterium]
KAREMGYPAVLIVGVPAYYPKLGFRRALEYGLALADGSLADAFMAFELKPGYLAGGGIHDSWAPEFERTEKDDAGYEAFHSQFMAEHFPGTYK